MKSMFATKNKGRTTLAARFIAPGQLKKGLLHEQKRPKTMAENNENFAGLKNTYGTDRLQREEQETHFVSIRRITGGVWKPTITMHFGEDEYKENDFPEECSYLDILMICRKFIDVESVGFKVTDGDGRWLKNDRDVLLLLEENENLPNIDLYLDLDKTAKPIPFKLPGETTVIASIPNVPKVRDLKILGEYKRNGRVRAECDVVNGFEHTSTVQWFISDTKHFTTDISLQAISECTTNKEFIIPLEAIDHFLVVKFTPKTHDGNSGETWCAVTDKYIGDLTPQKPRNVRGKNKNKKIATLRNSEKLEIQFGERRAVGENQTFWSRHLGKIIRDKNICPIQVKTWKDISESSRQHMWDSVKECFSNPEIESFRKHTLDHMGELWSAYRSSLNTQYVKNCKTKTEVLKNVPEEMNAGEWEWLVNNKFLTDEYQKISNQNSKNRANGVMPHRTGSKPHRQLIFDKGLRLVPQQMLQNYSSRHVKKMESSNQMPRKNMMRLQRSSNRIRHCLVLRFLINLLDRNSIATFFVMEVE